MIVVKIACESILVNRESLARSKHRSEVPRSYWFLTSCSVLLEVSKNYYGA